VEDQELLVQIETSSGAVACRVVVNVRKV
jgi:hypothetical protein